MKIFSIFAFSDFGREIVMVNYVQNIGIADFSKFPEIGRKLMENLKKVREPQVLVELIIYNYNL